MATVTLPVPSNISDAVPVFPGSAKAVDTSDVDVFAGPVTIFVGGSGNVAVRPANGGASVVFANVAAGTVLPCRVIGLDSTNTTATDFVAVY
jgi:hypothetical protein